MALDSSLSLEECVAKALPEACRFNLHHLSTPPTSCPAIFAAPPGENPERTCCESHFLSVSIDHEGHDLQVFAIEVLIYTTEYLTALFVSKADSTGYLYLLKLPQGTPSPLRNISTTFLQYLIERRRRSDRRLLLSLFARAQNQYLFPGSVENSHKHVLDDRGLIKWWCKVTDPLLGKHKNDRDGLVEEGDGGGREKDEIVSNGYLRVPGCDTYETQSFIPKGESSRNGEKHRWSTSDPLRDLGKSLGLPERCFIPRFPDDPKARFLETLDDEVPGEDRLPSSQMSENASKIQNAGRWRSVRSLEQFWEMMQFRQECSSGRLVGFLWATFQPASLCGERGAIDDTERSRNPPQRALPTPNVSQQQESTRFPIQSPLRSSPPPEFPIKTPPASPSKPSPAPTPVKAKEATIRAQAEETKYYYWPKSSRGEIVLRQKDFNRVGDQLLRMNYANEEIAAASTRKWINDVAERAGVTNWGRLVVGTKSVEVKALVNGGAHPTMLNSGLIRKKKRPAEDSDAAGQENNQPGISTLSAGLVRKKAKVASHLGPVTSGETQSNGKAELG